MKSEELKKIIKEEINDFYLNRLIENYQSLEKDNFGFLVNGFYFLLKEYRVNLDDIYKSEKKFFPQLGNSYIFKDETGIDHISSIHVDGTIKIGRMGLTNTNKPIIITKKTKTKQDPKILNTHISNLIKIAKEQKIVKINFFPESGDSYYEARKRLFLNIINQFPDKIENVRTSGDNFEIFLNH